MSVQNRQIARAMLRQRINRIIPNPEDIEYLVGYKVTKARAQEICDEFCRQSDNICDVLAADAEAVRSRKLKRKAKQNAKTTG